ncbi:HNH endonuclease [Pseudomonas jessenii]|uniref:HNH endonuclease n=1 Tax=Pseudomonas jessenii TaxID=77298 RepID=UPI0039DFD033
MRKIDCPTIQDQLLLASLPESQNESVAEMASRIADISARYDLYDRHNGDPWCINEDVSFRALKKPLNSIYERPPVALAFISNLRSSIEGVCPVCGRDALGTLDHYLPKANYSEFSFYSKNVVPACDRCNNKRSNDYKGTNIGERPLHPYFDGFASNRVITVNFEPSWLAPKLTPIPYNVTGTELAVVSWHIENVVRPAGIDEYLIALWGSLLNDLRILIPDRSSLASMKTKLDDIESYERIVGKSINSWRCAFWHGLRMNDAALTYLQSL